MARSSLLRSFTLRSREGRRAPLGRLALAGLTLGCALSWSAPALGQDPTDPQPAPGTRPKPTPAPVATPAPAAPGASPAAPRQPARRPLRYRAAEAGLLIQDPETGFSCTTPGAARAEAGGGQGPLAYELQARRAGWALRVRRDQAPPGASPRERAETLLFARALSKPRQVVAFRPAACNRWGVDAALAGSYPLGQGEAWERALVLVRGGEAIVLWETVDPGLGRPLVTELNGRFYASFRWGGEPRELGRTPSPYVDAEARLSPRGQRIAQELSAALSAGDRAAGAALLGQLAYSAADPPDEALHRADRAAIADKLSELVRAGTLSEAGATRLREELDERVRTPRDLRGLHQALSE